MLEKSRLIFPSRLPVVRSMFVTVTVLAGVTSVGFSASGVSCSVGVSLGGVVVIPVGVSVSPEMSNV